MEELLQVLVEALFKWLEHNEPWIKPVSYIVSPILAFLAFRSSRQTLAEMVQNAEVLGETRAAATQASERAEKRANQLVDDEKRIRASNLRIERLESDLRRITQSGQKLWALRDNKPFEKYREWYLTPEGAKVVTFGNLKGGVGKTTLAANFAAYLSRHKYKVLLVDLDYQGSLSNNLMLAAEIEEVESRAEMLLEDGANLLTLERAKVHLTPAIDRGWLVPASYPFAEAESRLLMQWLLPLSGEQHDIDVRYRLAHALLRPEVRQSYDVIIFDMPPRMSLGAVNALVASHYFVAPTILDKLSIEAIAQFLTLMRAVKTDMDLRLDFAGVVAMMTRGKTLSKRDREMLRHVERASQSWGDRAHGPIMQHLPRREAVAAAAGEALAYNTACDDGTDLCGFFDAIFAELLTRIGLTPPPEHLQLLEKLRAQRARGEAEAEET